MRYLLDTDTCIRYLRAPVSTVAQRLVLAGSTEVALSAVTAAELVRGAYRSAQVVHNLGQVNAFVGRFACIPLDLSAATIAGRLDAELFARGIRQDSV